MKVNCEYSETGGVCHVSLKFATTEELIGEIDSRVPCQKCEHQKSGDDSFGECVVCCDCVFNKNNFFKEAKK